MRNDDSSEWIDFRQFIHGDSGVTAIEYGLLAALIAVTCIGVFQATGSSLGDIYEFWSNAVIAAL
jgi:pilus assembly protein Flp/PilA